MEHANETTTIRRDYIIAMTLIVTTGCPDWEALADYLGFSDIKSLTDHWAKLKRDFIASDDLTTELGPEIMDVVKTPKKSPDIKHKSVSEEDDDDAAVEADDEAEKVDKLLRTPRTTERVLERPPSRKRAERVSKNFAITVAPPITDPMETSDSSTGSEAVTMIRARNRLEMLYD